VRSERSADVSHAEGNPSLQGFATVLPVDSFLPILRTDGTVREHLNEVPDEIHSVKLAAGSRFQVAVYQFGLLE
jgi:hypothetical protein